MAMQLSTADYNRAQAQRCRRLAREVVHTHPEVARALEALAEEFDARSLDSAPQAQSSKDTDPR